VSGLRRSHGPPAYTRLHRKLFARWAGRESGSRHFGAIGNSSLIVPPTMIRGHENIFVGERVVVHPGAVFSVVADHLDSSFEPRLTIGNGVRIGCDMVIGCCGSVEIEDDVLTADRVFIGDTYHRYEDPSLPVLAQGLADPRPVKIERGAFLGINCSVLPGVTVGEGAYVGANAVVTKDVPPRSLVVGNPARIVKQWDGSAWIDPR
jgi:acetyltransferase-like isoleucine patch superfamily enzyme